MISDSSQQLLVGRLLASPGVSPATGATAISGTGGRIQSIAALDGPQPLSSHQQDLLALPPLVNAHDHGRGIAAFTYGAFDQALELWLPSLKLQPQLSAYDLTALELAKLARSGVGAAVHCHNAMGGDLLEEAMMVAQAARDVGVRLALAVPMRDRNSLVYGDADRLLALLPAAERQRVQTLWSATPLSPQVQVERVHAIAEQCERSGESGNGKGDGDWADGWRDDLVTVQYCPWAPQWCSHELLEAIATASATTGRRIHTHLFESRYQREWADAHYPQGLIRYLDEIGFLSPRLTIAHGVWLRPDEMELLADRGVMISVNTSSNLRLRSGIAPYQKMKEAGMAIAFGLDGMALNDNADAFEEQRLNYHLHAQPGIGGDLSPAEIFAAHRHGFTIVTNQSGGILQPQQPMDILLVNYGAMTQDVIPDVSSIEHMLLVRGSHRYVDSLWIAGRQVMNQGTVLGIDAPALQARVREQMRSQSQRVYSLQPLVQSYQHALRQFYQAGLHQRGGSSSSEPSSQPS